MVHTLIIRTVFIFVFLCVGFAYAENNYHRAGDYKSDYNQEYKTNSLSLDYRKLNKKPIDLIQNTKNQLGLPRIPIPKDNLLTPEKISLGKKLFFDRRLSLNNTFSCAICHIPEQGFSSNELSTAVGIEGRTVRRNTPSIYNVAYLEKLFHDAREDSLEWQIWTPLLAKNEMGNPSFSSVVDKIKSMDNYQDLFANAFGDEGVSVVTIGKALASYQRTLVSANSLFDRWYYANEKYAISEQQKHGFELFTGKARCASCHTIGKQHALFTDQKMHNTGVGYQESMSPYHKSFSVQVAPGVFLQVDRQLIQKVSEQTKGDLGLYEITENPNHRWFYKTPSLRNVELSAPYMHNGSISNLEDVVEFYNSGGVKNTLLSPLITPLNLSDDEIDSLVAFLKTLTGGNVNDLIEDAFVTPIGEVNF